MKKIVKLTESDLFNIVKKVLNEQLANVVDTPEEIKQFQQTLVNLGYDLGKSGEQKNGVDGYYGPKTKSAIINYQKKNNINPTGVFDQTTQNNLGLRQNNRANFSPSDTNKFKSGVVNTINSKSGKKTITPRTKNKQKELQAAKKITGTTNVLNPNASLKFNGDELQWVVNGTVIKTWNAVSGLTWKNTPPSDWPKMLKRYTTSPESWSKDKDAGPTPPGQYLVGPIEARGGNTQEVGALRALWGLITGEYSSVGDKQKQFQANTDYSRISWGNYRAPIKPLKSTNTHGRHSFYVHGGSLAGSHGCIDLTDDMGDFAKFFGVWSSSTGKKTIPLIVNYKTPSENSFFSKLWS
jgi:peptidoglycan hydrolase-like protein with peptidoglycan-binding domain